MDGAKHCRRGRGRGRELNTISRYKMHIYVILTIKHAAAAAPSLQNSFVMAVQSRLFSFRLQNKEILVLLAAHFLIHSSFMLECGRWAAAAEFVGNFNFKILLISGGANLMLHAQSCKYLDNTQHLSRGKLAGKNILMLPQKYLNSCRKRWKLSSFPVCCNISRSIKLDTGTL